MKYIYIWSGNYRMVWFILLDGSHSFHHTSNKIIINNHLYVKWQYTILA